MRVLLAFDKFKDAIDAQTACKVAADAIRKARPDWSLDLCPLADGGDGFARILTDAAEGEFVSAEVGGPIGHPVNAGFGLVSWQRIPERARAMLSLETQGFDERHLAVLEMASASGLARLAQDQRDPWVTSTAGTGELLRQAAEAGAAAIVLGVGGSATNDLGLGALGALGLRYKTDAGAEVTPPIPSRWHEITRITGRTLEGLPPIRIACDTDAPLLGKRGAAAAYGPQKGLRPGDLRRMEHESARLALMLCTHCGVPDDLIDFPGAGAAGGLPFGLTAACSARIVAGADLVSAWLDLDRRIAEADIVLTGEGRFDEGSLTGKAPGQAIHAALAAGKPVHLFAGTLAGAVHALNPKESILAHAVRDTAANLARSVAEVLSS
jgi:glycerate kinase